eukprot:CAMPEP_0195520420 /NCGR_PEP_ID=MMETSP0794_2-20130614/16817_1 /TAXON_ID=515487 /ORGANISM="Stephanopyxis turris, Strain CCMP 815" /LENGTH=593 /DNA_ID=CAMNT_0040649767 /DNA_START=124 /DNA_END=1902 /DNA_ORIENTATION=+
MKFQIIASLSYVCMAFLPKRVESIDANPECYNTRQPDGTSTGMLCLTGDEFDAQEEDETGHTTMMDRHSGYVVYAMQESNGILAATALQPGKDNPEAMGIPPHAGLAVSAAKQAEAANFGNEQRRRSLWNEQSRRKRTTSSTTGTMKNLVVLIRFLDHYENNRKLPTVMEITELMNKQGGDRDVAPTGSVKDVFLKNSYNALTLESFVFPWVTVPNTEMFYASGNRGLSTRTHDFIAFALDELERVNFDFSAYDVSPKDGYIDAITVLHSGYGAEFGGIDADGAYYMDRIWSHKWSLWSIDDGGRSGWTSSKTGVNVNDYHISPALWGTFGSAIGRIGVIAHETAHFLGLPDLYDNTDGAGIGSFGMMGNSWGFDSQQHYPPHLSAWCKIDLGWISPTVITESGDYTLKDSARNPEVYRIDYGFPTKEYLLIENRQPKDFDALLPQGGLAFWHIDENVGNNNDEGYPGQPSWPENGNHYKIALLQADGNYHLEHGWGNNGNAGDARDLFHGKGVSAIGPSTSASGPFPNTDSYQNGVVKHTGITIFDISDSGDVMTFRVQLNDPSPTNLPVSAPTNSRTNSPVSAPTEVCLSW